MYIVNICTHVFVCKYLEEVWEFYTDCTYECTYNDCTYEFLFIFIDNTWSGVMGRVTNPFNKASTHVNHGEFSWQHAKYLSVKVMMIHPIQACSICVLVIVAELAIATISFDIDMEKHTLINYVCTYTYCTW